jgi:hypothetical protein
MITLKNLPPKRVYIHNGYKPNNKAARSPQGNHLKKLGALAGLTARFGKMDNLFRASSEAMFLFQSSVIL